MECCVIGMRGDWRRDLIGGWVWTGDDAMLKDWEEGRMGRSMAWWVMVRMWGRKVDGEVWREGHEGMVCRCEG